MVENNSGSQVVILDTDVFSFIYKRNQKAILFRPYIDGVNATICFATLAELYFGAYKANWGKQKITEMESEIAKYAILYPDYDICKLHGEIKGRCAKELQHNLSTPDCWIAAAALHFKRPLLTNNWNDFRHVKSLYNDLNLVCPGYS